MIGDKNIFCCHDPFSPSATSLAHRSINFKENTMARMVVIYRTPKDVAAFNQHYFGTHIPLSKKIPGLRKYEVSRGPVTAVAGKADVHLIGTLHFDDMAAINSAFASPEGQAAGADRRLFAPDGSGFEMYLFDGMEV
jgi:uncharacterized protein (TIGR02118 family)